jgi:hypothetical protein
MMPVPVSLDVGAAYLVGPAASIQFQTPILVRVIRVEPRMRYAESTWLDIYQLDEYGEAIERRSIYVRPEALVRAEPRFARKHRVAEARGSR